MDWVTVNTSTSENMKAIELMPGNTEYWMRRAEKHKKKKLSKEQNVQVSDTTGDEQRTKS